MSWTDIRPYFKTHLEAEGLTEWSDAFNTANIPEDILDGAFHVRFGDIIGTSFNQSEYQNTVQVLVRIFKNGFADPQEAYDSVVLTGQSVAKRIMKPVNRADETFKQVYLNRMVIEPMAESNDNSMFLEMDFTVTDVLDVRN